jgi:cytochrome c-type biogenesis protein CcmF
VIVYIGILGSKGYFLLESKGLKLEESMDVGKYTLTLENAFQEEHPNFSLGGVVFAVNKGGKPMGTMRPARGFYQKAGQGEQDTIESAIRHFGLNDLYIALGPLPENVPAHVQSGGIVSVQVYHNPLVNVVWLGVAVMVVGGLVATFEKRPKANV